MARIETWFDQDLNNAVKVHYIDGNVFSQDNGGNVVGVNVFKGGTKATLSGSVSANVIRADGATVAVSGSLDGNKCYIILPQAAYAVPGAISIIIKLTQDGDVTTLCAVVANVYMSTTDSVVDPGTIIPSVETLIAAIEAAVESIPADYSTLWDAVKFHNVYLAPLSNTGDTTHQSISYHYTGDNTYTVSGKNTTTSFYNAYVGTLAELGLKVGETIYCHIVSSDSSHVYGSLYKLVGESSTTVFGISNGYRSYTIPSDCTGLVFRIQVPGDNVQINANIKIEITKEPEDRWLNFGLNPGNALSNNTDLNNILENGIWILDSTNTYSNIPPSLAGIGCFLFSFISGWQAFQIIAYYPSTYTKVYMRVKNLSLGTSWSGWHVLADGYYGLMSDKYSLLHNPDDANYGQTTVDLDTLTHLNKFFLAADDITVTNKPSGWSGIGFIQCVYTGEWNLQLIYPFSGGKIYKRRGNTNGTTWEAWQEVSGGGGNTYNITNEYSFPEYSQTVTVNASPTITTDTNNFLASTGDNTDRTADILAMLSTTGICRLGSGLFVVNNLQMPDGSSIIGSGYSSIIRLAGTSDGYALKIGSRCLVKDVRIRGAESDLTFTSTIGGRHGILWQGNYTQQSTAPDRSMVSNVWIYNFTGGGITCYDTGYGTSNALEVTNVYSFSCWAGINISYWSEFHKFTNVRCGQCYIGCVNNGGNNIFVNCDFSSNQEIAMLMDNSQGQSPNNTHGSCIGCVFNHTSHNGVSNSGVGIKILNCASGFMFTGCQLFFSQIYLEDTSGIVVADTNFGNNNCNVTISGGGTVLFANCMVEGAIPVSVTGNTNVHFVNCYNKLTGASWGS